MYGITKNHSVGVDIANNANIENTTKEDVCHATASVCNLLSKGVAKGQHDSSCGLGVWSLLSMIVEG